MAKETVKELLKKRDAALAELRKVEAEYEELCATDGIVLPKVE